MASKAQEYITMAAITEVPSEKRSEKRNLLRESLKVDTHALQKFNMPCKNLMDVL